MQLGFVSAILPELSLAEVASVGRATGYSCVEIMCWPPSKADRRYAGVTHVNVNDFTRDKAAEVKGTLAEAHISASRTGLLSQSAGAGSGRGAAIRRAHSKSHQGRSASGSEPDEYVHRSRLDEIG